MSDLEPKGIEVVRNKVEAALRRGFNEPLGAENYDFKGKLSIYPERVHPAINQDVLRFMCNYLSKELIAQLGDDSNIFYAASAARKIPDHTYVLDRRLEEEIIIDPSIGQSVKGHNHVFVGTRMRLKQLVLAGIPGVTIFGDYSYDHPQDLAEFFEEMWGSSSQILTPGPD